MFNQCLPLEKGINFRDQGGYKMVDGRRIKSGMLFRSGSLHQLTEKDKHYLNSLPIKTILDYRTQDEVNSYPDKAWDNADYHHVSANPEDDNLSANTANIKVLLQEDPINYMEKLYRLLPFNNPGYHKLSTYLQMEQPQPLVQHCMVGKDRTGVGCALTLWALGADLETVMEDYLLTAVTLTPFRTQFMQELSSILTDEELQRGEVMLSVKESFLMSAVNAIKERYKTIDNWLAVEYGFTEKIKITMQQNYLQN